MGLLVALAVGAIGALILGWSWRRERGAARAARAGLLDGCRLLFETAQIAPDGAGFPRLDGTIQGRRLILEFIPDTMTIRRLPQLWLCATLLEALPVTSGFAVLARPSGAEFYSLTERFEVRLDPPAGLPPLEAIRTMVSAYGFEVERLSDWGGLLRDNLDLDGASDYAAQKRHDDPLRRHVPALSPAAVHPPLPPELAAEFAAHFATIRGGKG